MEQGPLNVSTGAKLVPEKVDFPFVHGPTNTITIACSRQDPLCALTNENRGLVRKAADTVLHLIGYRRFSNTLESR